MISIVVPVYNSGDTLDKCVMSLLRQSYTDIQIILVDDGSDDKSADIADAYAAYDDRIKVIHKPNGGVSSARNCGINASAGEYIVFVDSDDTVSTDYCSAMLKTAQKFPNSVVLCGLLFENTRHRAVFSNNSLDILSNNDFLPVFNRELINPPVNKLFRADIIKTHKLLFDESLSLGEDLLFCLEYMKHTDGIVVINKPLYNYRESGPDSLSSKYRPDMQDIQARLWDGIDSFLDCRNIERSEGYCEAYIKILNNIFKNNLSSASGLSFFAAAAKNGDILKKDPLLKNAPCEKFTYMKNIYRVYRSGSYAAVLAYRFFSKLKRKLKHIPKKKRRKIYLKAYTKVNLGDDLFIDIITARYPDTDFMMFADGRYKNIFKGRDNLKIIPSDSIFYRLSRKILSKFDKLPEELVLRRSDASVYIGGSLFIENERTHGKALLSFDRFICKDFCAVIGANFGPYEHESFARDYKSRFEKISDICFRDIYSRKLFADLENVRRAPDVIFNLDCPIPLKTAKKAFVSVIDTKSRKDLSSFHDIYIEKTAGIASHLVLSGYSVELASFCEYEKDTEAAEEILQKIPQNLSARVTIAAYTGDRRDMLKRIAESQIVIAARFHACILGLLMKKKVIPLIYSEKTVNYLKSAHIEIEFFNISDIEKLTPEYLDILLGEYKYPDIAAELSGAAEQFSALDKFLSY